MIFVGIGVLLSVCALLKPLCPSSYEHSQTVKNVRADQDTLSQMFERIEAFFRRLDIYTKVAPNEGMVETIIAILIEALNFIGIATKEMKQGRTSKRFVYK